MNKIVPVVLLFFFASVSFVATVSFVSAPELISDSWNTKTPMTHARSGLGVVAVDDKIYAIGGVGVNGYAIGANERYDPETDTWITLKHMPTPRAYFGIATYQGKIYCIGGSNKDGGCRVNEVYDTVTDQWSTKVSLPFNADILLAIVVDGKIFVITGQEVFMYSIAKDLWTEKTRIPYEPDSMSPGAGTLAVVNNKLIIFCTEFTNPLYTFKNTVMLYNTETDTWSQGANPPYTGINPPYPYPFFWAATGVTTGYFAPQRVYVLHYTNNILYNPAKDTWTTAKDMPTERRSFGVAVVDDVLYVIGGYTPHHIPAHSDYTEPLAIVEQYVPIGYSTVPLDPEPSDSLVTSDPKPSNSLVTSKPEPANTFGNYLTATVLIIIIGFVAMSIFFILRKSKENKIVYNL